MNGDKGSDYLSYLKRNVGFAQLTLDSRNCGEHSCEVEGRKLQDKKTVTRIRNVVTKFSYSGASNFEKSQGSSADFRRSGRCFCNLCQPLIRF